MQDWSTHGVSIISDGWSNLKNQPLINIMAISGAKKTRLLTRYRDDYENFNNWDAYPEDVNIEEDFTTVEQRDNMSLSDSEENEPSFNCYCLSIFAHLQVFKSLLQWIK
ncbi:unnamed protein product [Camellia sinensis]